MDYRDEMVNGYIDERSNRRCKRCNGQAPLPDWVGTFCGCCGYRGELSDREQEYFRRLYEKHQVASRISGEYRIPPDDVVLAALARNNGHRTNAARELGVSQQSVSLVALRCGDKRATKRNVKLEIIEAAPRFDYNSQSIAEYLGTYPRYVNKVLRMAGVSAGKGKLNGRAS